MFTRGSIIKISFLLVLAISIWAIMLRSVDRKTGTAKITGKYFVKASTYTQQLSKGRTNTIPIAEQYHLDLKIEGVDKLSGISVNVIEEKNYVIGQQVTITYEERGIPVIWQYIDVLTVTPLPFDTTTN